MAGARHGPPGEGVKDLAVSIGHTWIDLEAGVATVARKASKLARTLPVGLAALGLWGRNWKGQSG